MARPTPTRKPSVNLAAGEVRVSRIRRDPPPAVAEKKLMLAPDERDRWIVAVGVVAFALALFVIVITVGRYAGWSPSQYTVQLNAAE